MRRRPQIFLAVFALLLANAASGQPRYNFAVPATSNIFAAGQTSAFSGTLPPVVSFPAGTVPTITLAATGKITLGAGEPYSGPRGVAFFRGTNLASINGISGIINTDVGFFLTGVFLDDSMPFGSGPPILNFTYGENYLTLAPQLFQTFYAGNGFVGGTQQQQTLIVPPTATRLFLGVADGCTLDAGGPPGCYNDNLGQFLVSVALTSPPE